MAEVEKLVERLRGTASVQQWNQDRDLMREAAATLERLSRELDEAGHYTAAHERLDDLARERMAAAEAQSLAWQRRSEQFEEAERRALARNDDLWVQVEAMRKATELYECELLDVTQVIAERFDTMSDDAPWTISLSAGHWRCLHEYLVGALKAEKRAAALSDLAALDADLICGPESVKPCKVRLRKWGATKDEVTICLTGRPDDDDMERLNAAVRAFAATLASSTPESSDNPIGPFQRHRCACGHEWSAPVWPDQVCPACDATVSSEQAESGFQPAARPSREDVAFILHAGGDRGRVSSIFHGMSWAEICAGADAGEKGLGYHSIREDLAKAEAVLALIPTAPTEARSEQAEGEA